MSSLVWVYVSQALAGSLHHCFWGGHSESVRVVAVGSIARGTQTRRAKPGEDW